MAGTLPRDERDRDAVSVAETVVWLNGSLVDERHARISPFDHGFLVGDGVFETLRVYAGLPFAWRRHLDRLDHSLAGLGLPTVDRDELAGAAKGVLAANSIAEGRLRITVTGGIAPLGSERGDVEPTMVVAASALERPPQAAAVVTVPWPRNERGATAGLKTISYAENVLALAYAHERDATEAIFCNTRGELCEATGSNLFVVHDGVVRTPPPDAGCLLGVTRDLVLELCARLDIPAEQVVLARSALTESAEVLLTSTTREVQAVAKVDETVLPDAPGPTTARLQVAFRDLVATDLDP